jgi:RNA polymerase sigma factor (sigma-70 family)
MDMPLDDLAQLSDDALLVAYANGEPAAARVLTGRLAPRAFAQAFRALRDRAEAEDLAQEAMLRLWRVAPDWRQGEAQVTTWLYRVVANLATDRLRARRRSGVPIDAIPDPADDRPGAEAELVEAARRTALAEALAELPEGQRKAVELRHIEGLSNPDIAALMDISVRAVESLTARGKRALAAILGGRREELGYDD